MDEPVETGRPAPGRAARGGGRRNHPASLRSASRQSHPRSARLRASSHASCGPVRGRAPRSARPRFHDRHQFQRANGVDREIRAGRDHMRTGGHVCIGWSVTQFCPQDPANENLPTELSNAEVPAARHGATSQGTRVTPAPGPARIGCEERVFRALRRALGTEPAEPRDAGRPEASPAPLTYTCPSLWRVPRCGG